MHYFTDSGIIGNREFGRRTYRKIRGKFGVKRDKTPRRIKGLAGI
jgi:hypothetical protein